MSNAIKDLFEYCLFCWKLKTENNKKINNKKVTVHAFGTVHEQWTVPDTRPGKEKKAENATQETQYPNAT